MAARKKPKANPYAKRLASITKSIAKTRAEKLHRPLFDVFEVVAAAGNVAQTARLLDWMYGPRTPAPKEVATAFSTLAIDGFCFAAKLGDRTGGLPFHERSSPAPGPLAARVAQAERIVRGRLTLDAYGGNGVTSDAWEQQAPRDRKSVV